MTNKRFCDETGKEIHEGYTLTSDFRSEWSTNKRLDFDNLDALCRWVIRERSAYQGLEVVQAMVDEIRADRERWQDENLCGGEYEPYQHHILKTSYPAQKSWRCKQCGHITHERVGFKPGPCIQLKNRVAGGYVAVPADLNSADNAAAADLSDLAMGRDDD